MNSVGRVLAYVPPIDWSSTARSMMVAELSAKQCSSAHEHSSDAPQAPRKAHALQYKVSYTRLRMTVGTRYCQGAVSIRRGRMRRAVRT